jgi:hypothetical protein
MKQETLEEAADKFGGDNINDDIHFSFIAGANWQAERMYSEEDMISFATWLSLQHFDEKGLKLFNELFLIWFEKHKKK